MKVRLGYIFAGVFLVVAFFGLGESTSGLDILLRPPWDYFSRGELHFWLASAFFLAPAGLLIGAGLAPALAASLERLAARLGEMSRRDQVAAAAVLGLIAVAIARLGNQLVFGGLPFTDDEYAVRFGGEVLASGQLRAPIPPARELFGDLFLYQRDGGWTSMDYLGSVFVWGLAELTGTGNWIFHLLAGAGVSAVALCCGRRFGVVWGAVAGIVVLVSPMLLTLSMTTHAQLVSRGFLAVGLAAVVWNDALSARAGAVGGAGLGFAFLARPPEVGVLIAPLVLLILWRARSDRSLRRGVAVAVGVFVAIQVVGALYYLAVTGSLLPPRFAANDIVHPYLDDFGGVFEAGRMWTRFGANLAYNLLSLGVWFLGPVGVALFIAGIGADRWTAALAVGVALDLLLALTHDDLGLHVVGPIHYAEAAVPIALIAVAGLRRLVGWARGAGIAPAACASALAVYALVPLLLFSVWSTVPLANQASMQDDIYEIVESRAERRPAIVLAPKFAALWTARRDWARNGSWIFEWRRARADLSESVLILKDGPAAHETARAAFPDRAIYRLTVGPDGLAMPLLFEPR